MHRLVIALTALLTLIGASVVGLHLFLSGRVADPAPALMPADTRLYLSIYLEPSPAQRENLAALLGRLPGFGDQAALDQKIEQIATNLLGQAGIDYRRDVASWLGDRAAIGLTSLGTDGGEAEGVEVLAVKDRQAADEAVPRLVAGAGGELRSEEHDGTTLHVATDDRGGYAFVGEMLVVGSSADQLRGAVEAANERVDSLADDARFAQAMAAVPADNLAALYVDIATLAEAGGSGEPIRGLSSLAAALVAEERGIRIAGRLPIQTDEIDPAAAAVLGEADAEPALAGWMPEETTAAAITFRVADALRAAEGDDSAASSLVFQLRAGLGFGLGLDLDEDVLPLLDGEVGIALTALPDPADGLPRGQAFLKPTDPSVVEPTLERIRDAAAGRGAEVTTTDAAGTTVTTVELPQIGAASYAVFDGVVVLGLAPEDVTVALEARAAGATLGESTAYRSAFGLLERHAGPEVYLDLEGLVAAAGQLGADTSGLETLPEDARAILDRVEAFALSAPATGDALELHAAVTVR